MNLGPNLEWYSTREALIELENLFRCSQCKELYQDPVTVASCNHHFCRSCFFTLVESRKSLVCPQCQKPVWNSDVKPNRAFSSTITLCNKLRQLVGMGPQKVVQERALAPGSEQTRQLTEIFKTPLPPKPVEKGSSCNEIDAEKSRDQTEKDMSHFGKIQTSQDGHTKRQEESKDGTPLTDGDPEEVPLLFTPIPFRTRSSLKRLQEDQHETRLPIDITTNSCKRGKVSCDKERDEYDSGSEMDHSDRDESRDDEVAVIYLTDESDASQQSQSSTPALTRATSNAETQQVRRSERYSAGRSQKKVWRNQKGETLLHVACIKGNCREVERLLKEGAEPNVKDNAGWTPLHEACNHGYTNIVTLLLDSGAIVNMPGFDNETPLHDAVSNGHVAVVKLLLSRGASTTARNCDGLTPQDYAASPTLSSLLTGCTAHVPSPVTSNLPSPKASSNSVISLKSVVLLATSLNENQKRQLREVATSLKAKVQHDFSPSVTHVVTSCNREGQCPRTLKCLFGILTGKWIVGFEWVSKSLKYNKWQDEEQYEVADAVGVSCLAPGKGRQNASNKLPGLLDGCYFFLSGDFIPPTPCKEDLIRLIEYGGGKILHREPKTIDVWQTTVAYHQRDSRMSTRLIVYDNKSKHQSCHVTGSGVSLVSSSWLLDCIVKFELLPIPRTY